MPSTAMAQKAPSDLGFLVSAKVRPEATLPQGFAHPPAKEKMLFFRSLATLFRAGVPIHQALEILSRQMTDPGFRLLIARMNDDVLRGHSLTAVFNSATPVFSPYHVRMIRVGEMTGKMDDALEQMALSEEKSSALRLKLKSALSYPLITMALAIVFLLFVPPYLMDGLFDAVTTTGGELPTITVLVQSFFNVVRDPIFQIIFALAAGALAYFYPRWSRSPRLHSWLLDKGLRFPATRRLCESLVTARFARAFSTMLEAGVPAALALRLAGEEIGTSSYKQAGIEALYRLENGATFLKSCKRIPHLRTYFHEMLKAGEETGTMSDLTSRAASMAEEEVEYQLEVFGAMLEPLVIMFIGTFVGILVVSSMLPMLSVLESL